MFGKFVRLESSGKDRYGRTLADVLVRPAWVNESQVRAGVAWVYRQYSRKSKLLAAEGQARAMKRGLWIDKDPVPPWEFRRAKGAH